MSRILNLDRERSSDKVKTAKDPSDEWDLVGGGGVGWMASPPANARTGVFKSHI